MLLSGACCNSLPCVCLTVTAADTAGVDSMTCLMPAAPSLDTFCPSGTTLAPDAVTPVMGTCRHLCTEYRDDWGEGHVCSDAALRNSDEIWDESTAQCGVGLCNRHTTQDACEAGDDDARGTWEADGLSEMTCSDVQLFFNFRTYASSNRVERQGQMGAWFIGATATTCCSGFDAGAYMTCSLDADVPLLVRPLRVTLPLSHTGTRSKHAAADENWHGCAGSRLTCVRCCAASGWR